MKLKNIFLPMLSAFVGMAMTTSCGSDDDNWSPGPKAENEYQVYFTSTSEDKGEIDKGKTTDYKVTIAREDASKAASVPLAVSGDSELFDAPSTIDFAEGEQEKEFYVHFKGSETVDYYECQLSIDDTAFTNPYTSLTTSVILKLMVAKWDVVADNVHFSTEYSTTPPFDSQLLQLEGKEIYRFKKFMANYDLTFTLQEGHPYGDNYYYIMPVGGYLCPDWFEWDTTHNSWHFGDDGENTWSLYYNGDDSGNFYAWCFMFVGKKSLYGQYTYINFERKIGSMFWGYYYYSPDNLEEAIDCQSDYFNINWE